MDICYNRGILTRPSWLQRRKCATYYWEALPQALKTIQDGSGSDLVRFNFDIGSIFHIDYLIQERTNWSYEQWEKVWEAEKPPNIRNWYRIEAPFPPHESLRPHSQFSQVPCKYDTNRGLAFLCDDYVRGYTNGEVQEYVQGVRESLGTFSKLRRFLARLFGYTEAFP